MKKLVLFAIGAATLTLGACNRHTCPAYSSVKSSSTTITASTATPAARLCIIVRLSLSTGEGAGG